MIAPTLALLAGLFNQSAIPQERTVFQTGSTYKDRINLRADVAIVYGIDKSMPDRIRAWRAKGYRIHLMTGVAWGEYQDYVFGRWDGVNHEDEAQTRSSGEIIGHGKDVFYMSPGAGYGKFLAEGVNRALEAGVEAVHLEEPEFWNFGGYGAGFKREWSAFYKEPWQDPSSSPDARWRAAKLMYFLYRRALQQVFDSVQSYNKAHGTHVRCYVPTHSLLNYASWNIVSPESSLARLNGCDGYIAQVWTGTSRTPNTYQGVTKERTFETAFLEYGIMQNLVRSTGRSVWYLADPIEDNPDHDWNDYRDNYHATLIASLLQPEVSQYEVMPWPERIFNGTYPSPEDRSKRVPIPQSYATELQVVINALKDMKQSRSGWIGTKGDIGFLASDSLMFQRGGPKASDEQMGHMYGLALPFVKRGIPIQPIQMENVTLPGYLKDTKLLLLTYEGMKPLTPDVDEALATWVKGGGKLVVVDDDADPFLTVREWWNTAPMHYSTPRKHLFELLGVTDEASLSQVKVGQGTLLRIKKSPTSLARSTDGSQELFDKVSALMPEVQSRVSGSLVLRRGPYLVGAGLDETTAKDKTLKGDYVDLFDPALAVQSGVSFSSGARHFLVELPSYRKQVIAASGELKDVKSNGQGWSATLEGIAETNAVILLKVPKTPSSVSVNGVDLAPQQYDTKHHLLWIRFPNSPTPQLVSVKF